MSVLGCLVMVLGFVIFFPPFSANLIFCLGLATNFGLVLLQVTTDSMLNYINKLLKIPGSKLLFGGEALGSHSIPDIYGAIKPTALYVPLEEMLKHDHFETVTREIFGPFQVSSCWY